MPTDLRISALIQRNPDGTEYVEVIIPPFTPGTNRKVLLSDLLALAGGAVSSVNGRTGAVVGVQDLVNSATALTSGASIALTAIKHTLSTALAAITFTITYTGDDISMKVILSATSSVFTFPAGALCISDGFASGDNTCTLAGVSGDVYVFAIKHWGSSVYTVVCKNTGQ